MVLNVELGDIVPALASVGRSPLWTSSSLPLFPGWYLFRCGNTFADGLLLPDVRWFVTALLDDRSPPPTPPVVNTVR